MVLRTFTGLIFSVLLIVMQGCIKDPRNDNYDPNFKSSGKVYITCEGNYMWNNARLDIYFPDSQKVYANVFETVNHKPIGDVLQSCYRSSGRLWLVVNNSGKIVGINPQSLEQEVVLTGFKSPRYVVELDSNLVVSDLYDNAIKIVNKTTGALVKSIKVHPNPSKPIDGWSEHIVFSSNFVSSIAVAAVKGEVILLNPKSFSEERVAVDSGSTYLANDNSGRLWVLSSSADSGFLNVIEPDAQGVHPKVTKRFAFSAKNGCSKLVRSADQGHLLFIHNNQIRKISCTASDFSESTVVFSGGQHLYGMRTNFKEGLVYVADANDFVSDGKVYIFDGSMNLIKTVSTGVNPSNFDFD